MATSIRDLKKDINYVFGDILDVVDIWEYSNPSSDMKASGAISDEAFQAFDDLITKVNDKSVENRKAHLKSVNKELEDRGRALIEKINKLS